jgi:hypothetical protein
VVGHLREVEHEVLTVGFQQKRMCRPEKPLQSHVDLACRANSHDLRTALQRLHLHGHNLRPHMARPSLARPRFDLGTLAILRTCSRMGGDGPGWHLPARRST